MTDTRTYLDHNATTPLLPAARDALAEALAAGGNPSSVHAEGRAARSRVEKARAQVAGLAGVKPAEVIFTSGGSEANALALRGLAPSRPVLVVGATEHDSVRANAADLGAVLRVETLPVDGAGLPDLEALDRLLEDAGQGRALVSVMAANNETGVLAPLAEIARIARAHGALLHTDAVQAAGRIALDTAAHGADLLSLSAHKIGGAPGAGALIVREGVVLARQIAGGGQELGRRAGTENVPAIAAFAAAAAHAAAHLDDWIAIAALRDDLERRLLAAVPQAAVHGACAPRLPNTSMIGLAGVAGETQVMAMDLAGFAVSSGAACSSGKVKASHVLAAMGVAAAGDAIRISLGRDTSQADIDAFAAAWTAFAARALSRRVGLAA